MKGTMQKDEEPTREEQPKEAPFRMKAEPPDIKYDVPKPKKQQQTILDSEGLDKAYQQGDAYGNKNIAYVAGSHTARDWLDDVTKIPQWQYVPAGLNPIVDIMNSVWGRAVLGTGDLRRSERYQKA